MVQIKKNRRIKIIAFAFSIFVTGCWHMGYKYHHDGRNYKMSQGQIDYHKKAIREINDRVMEEKQKGTSELEIRKIECQSYKSYILDAPDEWAQNFTPAKELLERDEQKACQEYEKKKKVVEAAAKNEELKKLQYEAREKREQRIQFEEKLAFEEMKRGQCSEVRRKQYLQDMQFVKNDFDRMRRDGHFFDLVDHDIIVATQEGVKYSLETAVGGEIHIFIAGAGFIPNVTPESPVLKVEVLDEKGQRVEIESNYDSWFRSLLGRPSTYGVQLLSRDWEKTTINIRGIGCTMVMVFRKY